MCSKKTKIIFITATVCIVAFIYALYFSSPLLFKYKIYAFAQQNDEFKSKIWAHRVDSIEKAQEVSQMFKGFETDLVFDKNNAIFDVNHPPVESIHLSLAELLGSLANPSDMSYWLDFKNLSTTNAAASLVRLLQLCERFKINPSSIIVESESYQLLSEFTKNGFKTSYYLPTPFIVSLAVKSYRHLTPEEQQGVLRIQHNIDNGIFDYISTDSKYLPFIETLLTSKKKILLWNTSLEHHKFFERKKIKKILASNKDIRVLLTQLKSEYDR